VRGGPILPLVIVSLTPILVFTLIVVGVALGPVRWEPPNLWSTEFGTQGPIVENVVTSVSADSGGVYDAGFVGFNRDGGNATPSQVFVSRYDPSHHQLWSQSFGTPDSSYVYGVAAGTDGVYVVGNVIDKTTLNQTGFVMKYGLKGGLAWSSQLASPSSFANIVNDVSVGATGVYVTGSDSFSNSTTIKFLSSYNFTGVVLWTKNIGLGPALVSAGANALYVSGGRYLQRYDFDGNLQWNSQLSCVCYPSAVSTDGTGVYVAGNSNGINAFVAKYDWDGSQLWTREFRPSETAVNTGLSMSADSSGVYMAFTTDIGGSYVAKYDGNGNSVWLFRIPSRPYSISVGSGSVYVGGDTGPRGRNAILSEYSQSSSLIFFGLSPPFSFLAVSLLVAAVTISILWLKKRSKTRVGNSFKESTVSLRTDINFNSIKLIPRLS
jgi:hypothetical protein